MSDVHGPAAGSGRGVGGREGGRDGGRVDPPWWSSPQAAGGAPTEAAGGGPGIPARYAPGPGAPVSRDWPASGAGPRPGEASAATGLAAGRRRRWLPVAVAVGVMTTLVASALGSVAGIAWQRDRDRHRAAGLVFAPSPQTSSSRPTNSVAGIAQRVLPSVVSINVSAGSSSDTGSGFVLDARGHVLTNNHVISAAAIGGRITVAFNDARRTTTGASIVGRDPTSDLAVILVGRTAGLRPIGLGDSDALQVGDPVVAVGSPLGLTGTVTYGIVSAKDRPVSTGDNASDANAVIDAIQTDAAINPGNSGGPLVDSSGAVIGINSAIATLGQGSSPFGAGQSGSIGLGFAIPVNQARVIAQELIGTGHATHTILGVQLDPTYSGPPGALIGSRTGAAVTPDGPAARAGLRAGDLVTAVDGAPVSGPDDLVVAIRKHRAGATVVLSYVRAGRNRTVSVQLRSAPSS